MLWKVQHLCENQLKDINKEDIIYYKNIPIFRKCNTYKGGGGYDQFPEIYKRRYPNENYENLNQQFVVQLHGCPLDCPYCYVTKEGTQSNNFSLIETEELLKFFVKSNCRVFHLMGGAPALYIDNWFEILEGLSLLNKKINENFVFHSDLLLIENLYTYSTILDLAKRKNSLYAISIKGSTKEEFRKNTNKVLDEEIFWRNLSSLVISNFPAYLTFTNMSEESVENFKKQIRKHFYRFPIEIENLLKDSFSIDLIEYEALK